MELVERAADGIAAALEAVLPFSLGWLDDVFQLTVHYDASLAGAPSQPQPGDEAEASAHFFNGRSDPRWQELALSADQQQRLAAGHTQRSHRRLFQGSKTICTRGVG